MKWANPRRLPLFERIPVRWRIAFTTAGLTLLILVCFALVLGNVVGDRIRGDFREEVSAAASSLAAETNIYTSASGQPVVVSPRIHDFAAADKAVIRIYDVYGHALDPTRGVISMGEAHTGVHDIGGLTIATEPISRASVTGSSSIVGYVQYGRSSEGVDDTVARLWFFLGAGVLGGTLLAMLAGLAIANRAMRPIKGLTGLARQITSTRDPSKRIPAPTTDDEVGELARTMDGMLQALDEARSEREQALERQREFVADASHELRTPLTSIQANLELLLAQNTASEDDRHAVGSALSSTRRMSGLVSDLLLLARADAGRPVARTEVDLAQIAAGALEEVRPLAGERRVESHLEGPLPMHGSPDELHRLIRNLLENAVRHTPEKTTVELTARRDGDQGLLELLDDGPGIPAGIEEQVFDRFVRGEGPADTIGGGGSGLGLAIVRAVAQSHGGSVDAGKSVYGGARFSVRLPLESADAALANVQDRDLDSATGRDTSPAVRNPTHHGETR